MESKIQEITAFQVTIRRKKLARDKKSIQKIFQVLEECKIPYECMTINIDQLTIIVRKSEGEELSDFTAVLKQKLDKTKISVESGLMLLYIENRQMTSRTIGTILVNLAMKNIDIAIQRYLKCEDRLVIGVDAKEEERAKQVINEVLESCQ